MAQPHHVEVHIAVLQDAVEALTVLGSSLVGRDLDLKTYNNMLTDMGPELISRIDERCAQRGITNASDDAEWEFLAEFADYAHELAGDILGTMTGATTES